MGNRIDLHLHSNLSDGENTVSELIDLAARQDLAVIALTDHNLFAITEKIQVDRGDTRLTVIPGCEFSSSYLAPGHSAATEIHVVGLFPGGVNREEFADIFSGAREGKINYVKAILLKLETLGIHVTLDEVLAVHKEKGRMGRHRIADVMIQKGYAKNVDEAFDSYIGNFSPYYIPATNFIRYADMDVIVKRIMACHGIPVLCHALDYSFNMEEIDRLVQVFADLAGEGARWRFIMKSISMTQKR